MSEATPNSGSIAMRDIGSINLLAVTNVLCTQHLYGSNDCRKRHPVAIYLWTRERGIPPGTPLREVIDDAPKHIAAAMTASVATDCRVDYWGAFGGPVSHRVLNALEEVIGETKERYFPGDVPNGQGLYRAFLEVTRRLPPEMRMSGPGRASRGEGKKSQRKALDRIKRDPSLVLFPTDQRALPIARLTQRLLHLAAIGTPKGKLSQGLIDTFANAVLFAEIELPAKMIRSIADCYASRLQNYFPFALLYQAALAQGHGSDLVPGLNRLGYLLGFQGSGQRPYISEFSGRDAMGKPLIDGWPFFLLEVTSEQEQSSETPGAIALEGARSAAYRTNKIHSHKNPFRKILDEAGDLRIGRTVGRLALDLGRYPIAGQVLLSKKEKDAMVVIGRTSFSDQQPDSPFEVHLLEPQSFRHSMAFRNSVFRSVESRERAWDVLVRTNPVTRPPETIIKTYEDRRWREAFSFHRDHGYRIDADPARLAADLNQLDNERYEAAASANAWDKFERPQRFNANLISLAARLYDGRKAIETSMLDEIEVDRISGERRSRIICRPSLRQKDIDRVIGFPVQVALSWINLNLLGGGLTNFLPGCSPTLQSGPRFQSVHRTHKSVVYANLDVVKCFDQLRWRDPSFLRRMEISRDLLKSIGLEIEADLMWRVFFDYFLTLLSSGRLKFYTESDTMPVRGSLPTGFVLTPVLWIFLVLPLCIHLEEMKRRGWIYAWDLCGDDLMIAAPSALSKEQKSEILQPWFEFADELGLSFHFWKNYKDEYAPIHPKAPFSTAEILSLKASGDRVERAWSRAPWPLDLMPVYHAGVVVTEQQICVTPRLVYEPDAPVEYLRQQRLMQIYRALGNLRRAGVASCMLPTYLIRGWQRPELSTGEVANLVLGRREYSDRHIEGSAQAALMLWGPRTPVGRIFLDRKGGVQDPTFRKSGLDSFDFSLHLTDRTRFSSLSKIKSKATGRYFLQGKKMAERLEPTPPVRTFHKEVETPAVKPYAIVASVGAKPTPRELLQAKEPIARVADDGVVDVYIVQCTAPETYYRSVRDHDGKLLKRLHYMTRDALMLSVERERDARRKLKEDERREQVAEEEVHRLKRWAASYRRNIHAWRPERARNPLLKFFLSQPQIRRQGGAESLFYGRPVKVRLSELDELAFFLLSPSRHLRLSETQRDPRSIYHKREGQWIWYAFKFATGDMELTAGKGDRLIGALMRAPALLFAVEHAFWSPAVLDRSTALLERGVPLVPIIKPSQAKSAVEWRAGYFRHRWPRYLFRGWRSLYFPDDGDEFEGITGDNLAFASEEQLQRLISLIPKQIRLMDRLGPTLEFHRSKREGEGDRTAEVYADARAELVKLKRLVRSALRGILKPHIKL